MAITSLTRKSFDESYRKVYVLAEAGEFMYAVMARIAKSYKVRRVVIGCRAIAMDAVCSASVNVVNNQSATNPAAKAALETVPFADSLVRVFEASAGHIFSPNTKAVLAFFMSRSNGRLAACFAETALFPLRTHLDRVLFPASKAGRADSFVFRRRILAAHRAKSCVLEILKSALVSYVSLCSAFFTTDKMERNAGFPASHTSPLVFQGVVSCALPGLVGVNASLTNIPSWERRDFAAHGAKQLALSSKIALLIRFPLFVVAFLAARIWRCGRNFATTNAKPLGLERFSLFFGKTHGGNSFQSRLVTSMIIAHRHPFCNSIIVVANPT